MTPIFQKPGRREIFQRDCEPKHTVKITQELLKKKKKGGGLDLDMDNKPGVTRVREDLVCHQTY